jgi:DNA invertase Pin-like site-specific DNA recombinase
MTYDEQTAVRVARVMVEDGCSEFLPGVRRMMVRRLLDALAAQEREIVTLRQRLGESERREPLSG